MERIRNLSGYQKGVMVVLVAMVLLFTVLTPITISRVGYLYEDTILVPSEQDGATVYSGKVWGKQTSFTVFADKHVVFQSGDTIYGPYTMTEAPSAVPEEDQYADQMNGIEIRCGDETFFRGGVLDADGGYWLIREDGGWVGDSISTSVRTTEPSAYNIVDLMEGPELVHKGSWLLWFMGVVICALTALSMLFADELFRFHLQFSIRNVWDAEPSEWELMGRRIGWTMLTIVALMAFCCGLTEI